MWGLDAYDATWYLSNTCFREPPYHGNGWPWRTACSGPNPCIFRVSSIFKHLNLHFRSCYLASIPSFHNPFHSSIEMRLVDISWDCLLHLVKLEEEERGLFWCKEARSKHGFKIFFVFLSYWRYKVNILTFVFLVWCLSPIFDDSVPFLSALGVWGTP